MHQSENSLELEEEKKRSDEVVMTIKVQHINSRYLFKVLKSDTMEDIIDRVRYVFSNDTSKFPSRSNYCRVYFQLRKGTDLHKSKVTAKRQLKNDQLYQVILDQPPEEEDSKSEGADSEQAEVDEIQRIADKYDMANCKSTYTLVYSVFKRPRIEKKILWCPYSHCLKYFTETGNLKTHMRIHVRLFTHRPKSGRSSATSAARGSKRRVTCVCMNAYTQERNPMSANSQIAGKSTAGRAGCRFISSTM